MAVRQIQLSPEAEPILDSVAASFDGDAGLALSELPIAHESIESFLDEMEDSNAEELIRQCDRSAREFREGLTVSWDSDARGVDFGPTAPPRLAVFKPSA